MKWTNDAYRRIDYKDSIAIKNIYKECYHKYIAMFDFINHNLVIDGQYNFEHIEPRAYEIIMPITRRYLLEKPNMTFEEYVDVYHKRLNDFYSCFNFDIDVLIDYEIKAIDTYKIMEAKFMIIDNDIFVCDDEYSNLFGTRLGTNELIFHNSEEVIMFIRSFDKESYNDTVKEKVEKFFKMNPDGFMYIC